MLQQTAVSSVPLTMSIQPIDLELDTACNHYNEESAVLPLEAVRHWSDCWRLQGACGSASVMMCTAMLQGSDL